MHSAPDKLKSEIKHLMIEELMLTLGANEITDDVPIFSPEGLALDSVDALQLVVALDKHYGLKLPDADSASTVLHSVNTIAAAIEALQPEPQSGPAAPPTS